MKKNLLIVACLFLTMATNTPASEIQSSPSNAEVKQKACQNVFSLINIDLSVMSPRAAVSDVVVADTKAPECKKDPYVPVSNRPALTPPPATFTQPASPVAKNKTSLFRLDLLHIFKIQIF